MVDVIDGISDRESHVVMIERAAPNSPLFGKRTLRVVALKQMGVTQIYSAAATPIDSYAVRERMNQEEHAGCALELKSNAANLGQSSCARLQSGLSRALEIEGFDLASIQWPSETHGEQLAAKALGICFASFDAIYSDEPMSTSAKKSAIRQALLTALDLVPSAAYCTCAEKRSSEEDV